MTRRYYSSRKNPKSLSLDELQYKFIHIYLYFRNKDYFKGKAGITSSELPEEIKHKAAISLSFNVFPLTKWDRHDVTEDHIFDAIEFFEYHRSSEDFKDWFGIGFTKDANALIEKWDKFLKDNPKMLETGKGKELNARVEEVKNLREKRVKIRHIFIEFIKPSLAIIFLSIFIIIYTVEIAKFKLYSFIVVPILLLLLYSIQLTYELCKELIEYSPDDIKTNVYKNLNI